MTSNEEIIEPSSVTATLAVRRPVYVCLVSTGVGGAEKRSAEVWELLQTRGWRNVHLVVSRHLYEQLVRLPELSQLREGHPALVILECRSPRSFLWPLLRLAIRAGRGATFHYPLQALPLVHPALGQRLLLTYTANTFFRDYAGGLRRRLFFRMQGLGADKIEVLNPDNLEQFSRRRWSRSKVVQHPGSFVDATRYAPRERKEHAIVFSGRFADGDPKNVMRFVDAVPAIATALARAGVPDVKFHVLGDGVLEPRVRGLASEPRFHGIDVNIGFAPSVGEVLSRSRVFVSLQKHSNYPSKSLLEGMACGCVPVVTDVGETRLIAPPHVAEYVSADFTADALAQAITRVMLLDEERFAARAAAARQFVRQRFDIDLHYRHYLEFYKLA